MRFARISSLVAFLIVFAAADAKLFWPTSAAAGVPEKLLELKLPGPLQLPVDSGTLKIDRGLKVIEGTSREVVVRLNEPSVAETAVTWKARSPQILQLGKIKKQQELFLARVKNLDPRVKVLGATRKALNAVMLSVHSDVLARLAADPEVLSVRPVKNYELDLSETVPYIGGHDVQGKGYDGTGVRVAVLDSGIDYIHYNLGGSGDVNDFDNNDPTIIEPGTFPTAKVVGGYDFVGAVWPAGDLQPDPDPLDAGPLGGHGTHVADIIAGRLGVAPGAALYAVKVCSSVSTSCSGVALLHGMDYALDPDGDGDTSDRVDIINMSLGSPYGQAHDDDLAQAVENASTLGVLTVATSGNSSDKPYVTGTPGGAPSALSVAQTAVPSAIMPLLEIVTSTLTTRMEAPFQPWSQPFAAPIQGPIQYGLGANTLGCSEFGAGTLTGKIVLVDRGDCNFTRKIKNISLAGGIAGIIGLVAPGDPFEGGDGGERPIDIPAFMISQSDANLIKTELQVGDVQGSIDPTKSLPLVKSMVGSSSRGPTMLANLIKPEIGAPGASVSAVAGSGTGEGPFGGTSGAAPMVSGAAALLMQAYPDRLPHEIKALLMNTAETNIVNKAGMGAVSLAPISRIGAGEVRVDRALEAPAAAWERGTKAGALSFGFFDTWKTFNLLSRSVTIRNYSGSAVHYSLTPRFRHDDDAANSAIGFLGPRFITVPALGERTFRVSLRINGARLHPWALDSGPNGADPVPLTLNEYDGYFELKGRDGTTLSLPWHVLPRKSGNIDLRRLGARHILSNLGVQTAEVEAFSLLAKSPNLPNGAPGEQNPTPDFRYIGYTGYQDSPVCGGNNFLMAFAVNTWERQTHANAPASFQFMLDTDKDGNLDYVVLNRDLTFSGLTDGRNVTWVLNLSTNILSAFFYTDHATNSANTTLYFCSQQIGMDGSHVGTAIGVDAMAEDFYFGGDGDFITGLTVTPVAERFQGEFQEGGTFAAIGPRQTTRLRLLDRGASLNPSEKGLLLMYRHGPLMKEAAVVEP